MRKWLILGSSLFFIICFSSPGFGRSRDMVLRDVVPPQWGTVDPIVLTLGAYSFEGAGATTVIQKGSRAARYFDGGSLSAIANVNLPSGALVVAIEIEACDLSDTDDITASFYSQYPDIIDFSGDFLGSIATTDANECNYFFDALPEPVTIDNYLFTYFIEVNSTTSGSDIQFGAVRLYYFLQISPPPAQATFSDVPTTHPFFQYIEALASSGITTGYQDGTFRPDDPVTRKQMAAFLARALGLHWIY